MRQCRRRAGELVRVGLLLDRAAPEASEIGYMARAFVACTMPYRNPKVVEYVRSTGPYTLRIYSPADIGQPYGAMPRLVAAQIMTEVVRTRSREVFLGKTMTEAARRIGVPREGRALARYKRQLERCLAAHYHLTYDSPAKGRLEHFKFNLAVLTRYRFDPAAPGSLDLWRPRIVVSADLYEELVNGGAVPFRMGALRALKGSALGMDFYLFATHAVFRIRRSCRIPYTELMEAFGVSYPQTRQGRKDFKRKLLVQIKNVLRVWPELGVEQVSGGVVLRPGRPHVGSKTLDSG